MKIAVLVKQIPEDYEPLSLTGEFRLDRTGQLKMDDADSYGVETALKIAEGLGDSEVVAISMVPDQEVSGIRSAMAMGVSSAIVVSDDALAGADALTTAKVLAACVRHSGAEMLVCATESSDGYTGTVAAQIGGLLNWATLTFARRVELNGSKVAIHRQSESGFDLVEADLPAVVSVTSGSIQPRYPSFRGIMNARSKPVELLTLADLDIEISVSEEVVEVKDVPARDRGEIIEDDGHSEDRIVAFLESIKVI
jgi:electron transfer flavoprotein beta subunit